MRYESVLFRNEGAGTVAMDQVEGINWLQIAIPRFFFGADFEIEILPAEEEGDILGVRVYGSLPTSVFHKRRHALCKAMKEAGYRRLYDVISIFQRRIKQGG